MPSSRSSTDGQSKRLEGNNTRDQIQHRRERGRKAQAAFRKRQTDTIKRLEEQLEHFHSVVGCVKSVSSKLKYASDASVALGQTSVPLALVHDAVKLLEHSAQRTSMGSLSGSDRTSSEPDSHPKPSMESSTLRTGDHSTIHDSVLMPSAVNRRESRTTRHGMEAPDQLAVRPMFRADYERQQQVANPSVVPSPLSTSFVPSVLPIETLPYLAHAQHSQRTFAGQLYWACLKVAYQWIESLELYEKPAAQRMFAYHLRHQNREMVRRRIQNRLILYDSSVIVDDEQAAKVAETLVGPIQRVIIEEMIETGESIDEYVDSKEVELYLRRKCIGLDNVEAQTDWVSEGQNAEQICATLVDQLAPYAVCFGDGPRWRLVDVDRTVETATLRVNPENLGFAFPPR